MDKVWILKDEEHLKNWIATSDKDHGEGYSSCSLTLSPAGHGLFSGQISTQVKNTLHCSIVVLALFGINH